MFGPIRFFFSTFSLVKISLILSHCNIQVQNIFVNNFSYIEDFQDYEC